MPKVVLTAEEISARIKAARLLRGMTQPQLASRLRESGLTWRLAGELERGEQTMLMLHRMALAEALDFPERWFMVPTDELLAPPADETAEVLLERIASLAERFEQTLTRLERRMTEGD